MSFDKFYTCQKCSSVYQYGGALLDDKPICGNCLHDLRFGSFIAECSKRGYHETYGHGGPLTRDRSTPPKCMLRVHCRCGVSRSVWLECRATSLEGIPAWEMPTPSKFWAVVDGAYTPLSESDIAQGVQV